MFVGCLPLGNFDGGHAAPLLRSRQGLNWGGERVPLPMGVEAHPKTCPAHQYATGRRPYEASASYASWTHVRQISTGSRDTAVWALPPQRRPPHPQLSQLWPGLEGNLKTFVLDKEKSKSWIWTSPVPTIFFPFDGTLICRFWRLVESL